MKREDIVPVQDTARFIAKLSGKSVAHIKAFGPLNCKNSNKVEKIWEFYLDKIPSQIYDTLKSFGEIYCFFDTAENLVTEMENWFPSIDLINSDEYDDVDMDYYIMVESSDARGNDLLGV
jgi:hypothetical protein